jgi:hypothetical protein
MKILIIFIFILEISSASISSGPCFDCIYPVADNATNQNQLSGCQKVEFNIKTKFVNLKVQFWANVHEVKLTTVSEFL